jgi:hypothetical protein
MAAHDHGTKVSFPGAVREFDIPVVLQHLPVREPQGVRMLRNRAHRRLTILAPGAARRGHLACVVENASGTECMVIVHDHQQAELARQFTARHLHGLPILH